MSVINELSPLPSDPSGCDDVPCFEGVECVDLDRAEVLAAVDLDTHPEDEIIKFYDCGDCPMGYLGDGEYCLGMDPFWSKLSGLFPFV